MRRLLLVTHRSIQQEGGAAARWRAFAQYLPAHGWEVDVVHAPERAGAVEFDPQATETVLARARLMGRVASVAEPAFRLAGVRPDALPLSMLWIPRGAASVRSRFATGRHDVVLATGPPMAGPLAARLGLPTVAPLIVELRDLWAGSPAFDAGGETLNRVERWLFGPARRIVACTPEAVSDLRARHPALAERITEVSNGFDPVVWDFEQPTAAPRGGPLTLLHSGTLSPARPLAPLVRALEDPRVAGGFRLTLHGYISPAVLAELEAAGPEVAPYVERVAPSSWEDAVRRMAAADACLVTQARSAGDATAVASKVYEYLALGKPVVCLSDGGATEALLRRLGAGALCARLDEEEAIVQVLLRLRAGEPASVPRERLMDYSRQALAGRMAMLLDEVANSDQ